MSYKRYIGLLVLGINFLFVIWNVHTVTADWQIETVDSLGNVGACTSLALDGNGNPHISYFDWEGNALKYAYFYGSWHMETVDNGGHYTSSIALDSSGKPHISYRYSVMHDDLKYAHYNGGWYRTVVDSAGDVGWYSTLALDSEDNPHISYFDATNDDLKYAYYDGTWHTVTVESDGQVGRGYSSLALDSNNHPHISYDVNNNDDLKYAWCEMECHFSSNWHTEIVDSNGGEYTSIALDSNNNPHISYSASGLKYAHYDGAWHIETVDSGGGFNTSIALDSNNNPHISYYGDNADLKYAFYDGSWHTETVDYSGRVGLHSSIALDKHNHPHISYHDVTNYDLKYAFIPCQNDTDCDDVFNSNDNCPTIDNPVQEDRDTDGAGDVCDNCQDVANIGQEDTDGDYFGNVCDTCTDVYNPDQKDTDSDGTGDVCDSDIDGDGILNEQDSCPMVANAGQEDGDGDGFGDVCDPEHSFALIDIAWNKLVVFDLSGSLLYEKKFDGIGLIYFVAPSARGWMAKGCPPSGCGASNWIIWDLAPDLAVANTIAGLGPGPFYTGISSGNFVTGNVYSGIVDLYDPSGTLIDSTNVWQEENGWPYSYKQLGEIAGLVSGGFAVAPEGGYPAAGLYTPYLYFYDNHLTLRDKVNITPENIHVFNTDGLSNGGFVATCADYGTASDVSCLCFFNADGTLIEKRDVSGNLPSHNYMNVFITGMSDGRVMVGVYGGDRVWIYDAPSQGFSSSSGFAGRLLSDGLPEEWDLSGFGIAEIGSLAGNVLVFDSDGDRILEASDNCPNTSNPLQEDTYPPAGNGKGDACDCEADFMCDGDVDGSDAALFKADFGRSVILAPCTDESPCNGDFNCDGDADGTDASLFKFDFGHSALSIPCPACERGAWCDYAGPSSTTTSIVHGTTTTTLMITTTTMPITTTSTVPGTTTTTLMITTTTMPVTTTTTIPGQCELIISPDHEVVYTWEHVQFTTTLDGDCNPPCYSWEVVSDIGSTVDNNGFYTAGGSAGIDTVEVTDNCNAGVSDSAVVEVVLFTTTVPPATTIPPTTTTTAPS